MKSVALITLSLCTLGFLSCSESQSMEVEPGQEVTLTCPKEGGYKPVMFWSRMINRTNTGCISVIVADGKPKNCDGFSERKFHGSSNNTTVSLLIKQVDSTDDGPYFCGIYSDGRPTLRVRHLKVKAVAQAAAVKQDTGVMSANAGDNVTLHCVYDNQLAMHFSWYRQTFGRGPELLSSIYKYYKPTQDLQHLENNPRFAVQRSEGINHLHISDVQLPDSATYFCGSSESNVVEFGEGVFLRVKGSQSCDYNLQEIDLSSSDAGAYQCAVASCREVLFGKGSKLLVKDATKAQTAQMRIFVWLSIVRTGILFFVVFVCTLIFLRKSRSNP